MNETLRDLFGKNLELLNEADMTGIHEKYRNEELPLIRETLHKRLVGHAVACYKLIKKYGTPDEVKKMATYLVVCIDAAKHRLDYRQFAKDNGIDELVHKYGKRNETKKD